MNIVVRFLTVTLVLCALASGYLPVGESRGSGGTAFAQETAASSPVQVVSSVASTPSVVSDPTATAATTASQAARGHLPKLVDLGAGKCIPCKKMAPLLEEAKKLYEGLAEVVFIDVWENRDEAAKYGVRTIPTQIFYDATGKEVLRHEGFFPMEDIQKQFEVMGVVLKKP